MPAQTATSTEGGRASDIQNGRKRKDGAKAQRGNSPKDGAGQDRGQGHAYYMHAASFEGCVGKSVQSFGRISFHREANLSTHNSEKTSLKLSPLDMPFDDSSHAKEQSVTPIPIPPVSFSLYDSNSKCESVACRISIVGLGLRPNARKGGERLRELLSPPPSIYSSLSPSPSFRSRFRHRYQSRWLVASVGSGAS